MRPERHRRRRVCFVTGTRAEFGLMRSTLRAIQSHRSLQLQLVVTGMHLDRGRGYSIDEIRREGWRIDRIIPWSSKPTSPSAAAEATGRAMSGLARAFDELKSDIVLIVGDRVEAFAAASAAHICGCVVAHVHGGDRALGQVDDSLRHAITKLAHVHLPATRASAERIVRLGEERWRVHPVGSPGLDDLSSEERTLSPALSLRTRRGRAHALVVLHPGEADERIEHERARMILRAVRAIPFESIVVVYPNNDPGAAGIIRCWRENERDARIDLRPNVPRAEFLQLMRNAAVMVGNSSSGIIEAASFGTPVIDVGPRQLGRERGENVTNVPYSERAIREAIRRIWNNGRPIRFARRNVYGRPGAGERIARVLSNLRLDDPRLRRKLIAY